MNQETLDAVLKVLRENNHLTYYPEIIAVSNVFVAYDPYAIGTKLNAVRLIRAHEDMPWNYHPRWVNEKTAKMISLIIDEPLEKEENDIWNTGLISLKRYGHTETNR